MLQYITNTKSAYTVPQQVEMVIRGGCRWIQIRMKEASDLEIQAVVEEIKPLCLEHEAFLILDDRVELAKSLDVGGVHLGHNDMPPSQARIKLGAAAVIGATANTWEDIQAVRNLDIDYIGIGPYADTTTKENLAPILGVNGLRDLCLKMRENQVSIPIVAVGGITINDVTPLLEAGVNGVAVSGAIAMASDPVETTRQFVEILDNFK